MEIDLTEAKREIDNFVEGLQFPEKVHVNSVANSLLYLPFYNFNDAVKIVRSYLQTHPKIIWIQKDVTQPWITPGFYRKNV